MNKTIFSDFEFFLASLLLGAILLFLYDCIVIWRKILRHHPIFIALEDILYWGASGVTAFLLMYQMNYGILRGFAIIGIALGMLLYYNIISKRVLAIANSILNWLKRRMHPFRQKRLKRSVGKKHEKKTEKGISGEEKKEKSGS